MPPKTKPHLSLHLRLIMNGASAIGPGKAELLERIAATGSISEAARGMDMSYRRAWGLVREMNERFTAPLTETQTGGAAGGKTRLTPLGAEVLAAYRAAEAAALKAAETGLAPLRKRLRR